MVRAVASLMLFVGCMFIPWMACTIPKIEEAGQVDDAGSCSVLVVPGSCAEVGEIERQLEAELPCNTCVSYRCDCTRQTFCKVCGEERILPASSWGCTTTAPAWCVGL